MESLVILSLLMREQQFNGLQPSCSYWVTELECKENSRFFGILPFCLLEQLKTSDHEGFLLLLLLRK